MDKIINVNNLESTKSSYNHIRISEKFKKQSDRHLMIPQFEDDA